MKYSVQVLCEQGPVRPNNEDAVRYGVSPELGILWVAMADGMGGHNAGEVASEMLVDQMQAALHVLSSSPEQGWGDWLVRQLGEANAAIFSDGETHSERAGMGTTGVVMIVERRRMTVAWVGDSRAYVFRDYQLCQLTQDHSMLQYLLDKGAISKKQAASSDSKHLLSRAVGIKAKVEVDQFSQSVQRGDVLMLSTDGLHDRLSEKEIAGYLEKFGAGEQIAGDLINQAIAQGSRDNLTVALIRISN